MYMETPQCKDVDSQQWKYIKGNSDSWQSESEKDAYFWFCWHFEYIC